jgi:hypothetical protein
LPRVSRLQAETFSGPGPACFNWNPGWLLAEIGTSLTLWPSHSFPAEKSTALCTFQRFPFSHQRFQVASAPATDVPLEQFFQYTSTKPRQALILLRRRSSCNLNAGMVLRNLDLDTLRTLVTTHDVGGFAQAADRLGRTPSAISLQMKRLQEELGTSLFRKHGGALKLTEAGQTALGYARRMLARMMTSCKLCRESSAASLFSRKREGRPVKIVGLPTQIANDKGRSQ